MLVPLAAVAAIVAVIAAALFLAGRRDTPAAAPPTVTVERLTGSGNVIDAIVSPDGKYLAYVESSRRAPSALAAPDHRDTAAAA